MTGAWWFGWIERNLTVFSYATTAHFCWHVPCFLGTSPAPCGVARTKELPVNQKLAAGTVHVFGS